MKLLMISGDRSILSGKRGAFWYTLQEMRKHWDRIDVLTPNPSPVRGRGAHSLELSGSIQKHEAPPPLREGQAGGAERGVGGGEAAAGEVHFHPSPRGLWYQPLWILKEGQKLYATHRHDVMTVHEYPPFYNGLGARMLATKIGIPYAIEIHHVVGHPLAASFVERIGKLLSRFILPRHARSAGAVRTVNRFTRSLLAQWGIPKEKMSVVSSFYLDRSMLTKDVRPPISYDVSFSGRIVANKQLMSLIEAVADIPEIRLLVIGDGPERARCEKRARDLGMGERATFLGWLPTMEDVVGAVMTARIFVMNSRSEGGPRTALEAMAMGMPVIATPVGVMPDVIDDGVNGLFTDGSPGDLRRKIMRLIEDDEERRRLGAQACKILDRFDRVTLVREYAEFLKSLAAPRS